MRLLHFAAIVGLLLLAAWLLSLLGRLGDLRERVEQAWAEVGAILSRKHALASRLEGASGVDAEDLQEELGLAEKRLPYATQRYDLALERYNEAIAKFPASLLAKITGHRPRR